MLLSRIWKDGAVEPGAAPVHVSMNDSLVMKPWEALRVAREGLRLRSRWPQTEGALGLWFAAFGWGRRQVSISVWRSHDDLNRFVHSAEHVRIMRAFRDAGSLMITTTWSADRCDRALVWQQGLDRLEGRVEGVPHH
jgi:hypothetical protein